MTPEERAEKILAYTDGSWTYEQAIEKIAAELEAYASERSRAAVEEATELIKEDRDRWADSACRLEKAATENTKAIHTSMLNVAKAEAYEHAAKMGQRFCSGDVTDCNCDVASYVKSLRALAKDLAAPRGEV